MKRLTELLDYCPRIYAQLVHRVTFLKQLKFKPRDDMDTNLLVFSIYCDPHFQVNTYARRSEESQVVLNRFSVVQYNSKKFVDVSVGQVIGILEFEGIVQVIVSRLEEERSSKIGRKLPYPMFKYGLEPDDKTRFTFEQVPLEDIVGPCFSVNAVDHVNINFKDCGKHHGKAENTSYFYVLSPNRARHIDILSYEDFISYNSLSHPWEKRQGNEKCYNFNYYLVDKEKVLVRDVINA